MTLRELFIGWITRVKAQRAAMLENQFILHLHRQMAEQRSDFQERLGEKDAEIKILRSEIAALKLECDRMRSVLLPTSPLGAAYAHRYDASPQKPPQVPAFNGPDDWTAELNRIYREEQDGTPIQRREEIHEQASDDGA